MIEELKIRLNEDIMINEIISQEYQFYEDHDEISFVNSITSSPQGKDQFKNLQSQEIQQGDITLEWISNPVIQKKNIKKISVLKKKKKYRNFINKKKLLKKSNQKYAQEQQKSQTD
ncbi:hypothetical protein PPERSA_09260 [Pseudocohnilembus persalinus]|uniref:Uncharacterized protein n=1 Tax=Pseudocohnilembus persalinus TaxID=266149 RepID=A0A0V0QMQ6_PSEPJ|nr:hypothetical protein PPERSA_09260 [Pseudocohnilembus persalinus]|eukprot:KRX03248.1 hypothetical protein PPERSA_09260 [Pseudocohnilembus persalinus]